MTLSIEIVLSIVSAVIAVASLTFSLYNYICGMLHDRKRDTLDAFNVLQEQALDKLNKYMPSEIQEISKHPKSPEYKTVIGYIARIEHFCVGVNEGIYDLKTLYLLAHGYLDGSVIRDRIIPMIDGKKEYYENIEKVFGKMQKRSKQR